MATKAQVKKALEQHAPGALLDIDDFPQSFQAILVAPVDHHWEGSTHARCLPEWFSGPRSEYWDMCLEEIRDLPPAVPCVDDDCEGIATWGECEYWCDDQDIFGIV